MERELFRLSTFSSLAADASASPLTLARCGFCYDGTQGTVSCAACNVEFDPLELSSGSIPERHRQQSPFCRFATAPSAPNTPPNLSGLALPVGSHTASDDGSQIGPDRSTNSNLQRIFSSALARANRRGVFQTNPGSNTEPSGSVPQPEAHADPRLLNQGHVVYRREQPDYEQLQCEESRLHTFINWPVNACVDCRALAREGFFYTGEGDRVQCAFCHGYLKNWKATDIIKAKHQKYFPNCPFLRGLVVSERPSDEQTSQPSSSDSPESIRNQRVTVDDPVAAVMDRKEVSILLPIIENLGFSENDLRTLVTQRLSQGLDCLSPRKLLEALLMYQRL